MHVFERPVVPWKMDYVCQIKKHTHTKHLLNLYVGESWGLGINVLSSVLLQSHGVAKTCPLIRKIS